MSRDESGAEAPHIIAVAREAEAAQKPQIIKVGALQLLSFPNGSLFPLEKYEDAPRRKRASVHLYETKSFIEYVNGHKIDGQTHLFGTATETGGSITAVFDFHKTGVLNAGTGEHVAVLRLESTPEWNRWIQNNRKLLTQEGFSEFVEENLADIVSPDGAEVLEMAQLLQAKKTVSFKSGKNLRDGSIQLEYVETIEQAGGGANRHDDVMKLPDAISIFVVPFVGSEPITINARLRFRIGNDGKLSFQYVMNRPHEVIKKAFDSARASIEATTSIPVLLGDGKINAPSY